ncbi:hypothetical protein FVER14953_20964 [Fusarium verticillioides]|nr:hypothetical protein FVER14953_20964 [Fusarium verticillioides]
MIEMEDWDDTLAKFPFLDYDKSQSSNIDKRSFRAVFNRNAGWVDPVIAMQRVRDYCKHHGVRFISGDRGTIVNLIRDNEGRVTGVEAKDGTKYTAGRVILAMGAYSDTLLDYESQLEATAYVVSHVKLTEEQYQKYKNMPVINMSRRGYIFPPKEDRILKVCNTDTSYLNSESSRERNGDWGSKSTPRDPAYHPTDTQPTHGKDVTQWFLKNFLPELASGQLHSSRLCWDAEAHDYSWIIGTHPSSPDSLYIATGGSGHSFKNFVNVGKYVVQMMDGKLDEKLRDLWRWRPDRVGVDLASEERPRRPKIELKGAEGWNHDEEKET